MVLLCHCFERGLFGEHAGVLTTVRVNTLSALSALSVPRRTEILTNDVK